MLDWNPGSMDRITSLVKNIIDNLPWISQETSYSNDSTAKISFRHITHTSTPTRCLEVFICNSQSAHLPEKKKKRQTSPSFRRRLEQHHHLHFWKTRHQSIASNQGPRNPKNNCRETETNKPSAWDKPRPMFQVFQGEVFVGQFFWWSHNLHVLVFQERAMCVDQRRHMEKRQHISLFFHCCCHLWSLSTPCMQQLQT